MFCKKRGFKLFVLIFISFIFFLAFVIADFDSTNGTVYGSENNSGGFFYYNVSNDDTGFDSNTSFDIDTAFGINSSNSEHTGFSNSDFYWIFWNDTKTKTNSNTGILVFNSTKDNETGKFTFRITSNPDNIQRYNFTINATNDAPVFSLLDNYNTTSLGNSSQNISYAFNISGTDEEGHYPLNFTISSFNSCSLASWSTRNESEGECNLTYSWIGINESVSTLNFTNINSNDVGVYNLTICSYDNATGYESPTYSESGYNTSNEFSCQNTTLKIFSPLELNVSDCSNLTNLNESGNLSCVLNIKTRELSEDFNISSVALINGYEDYSGELISRDWFYFEKTNTSVDSFLSIPINISLNKSYVGNWTINLSLESLVTGNTSLEEISFFINKTSSSSPELELGLPLENKTSIGVNTSINLSFYDNDFLIPDKNLYNETIFVNISVFEKDNSSNIQNWEDFSNKNISYMPGNNNLSFFTISSMFNQSQAGNWTINVSYEDIFENSGTKNFDLEIINNSSPEWNKDSYLVNLTVNSTLETTESFYINLTNSSGNFFANDSDWDDLIFSSSGDFENFNLTSLGIINFTPWKKDVSLYKKGGDFWNITLIVSDGYLTSNTTLFFNISNINSQLHIENLTYSDVIQEDNNTLISFRVYDEDLKINRTDEDFIKEITTMNLTNIEQVLNFSYLFNATKGQALLDEMSQGYVTYTADFTPEYYNVGNYSITLNFTDSSEESYNWTSFNFSIVEVNDPPNFTSILNNITTTINQNLILDINASDEESGNDTLGNLTFSYENISGEDIFENYFNSSTGRFNMTLNPSHSGKYHLNFSVRDENISVDGENNTVYEDFWIYIYDYPNITFPSQGQVYDLSENSTFEFNFTGNHTLQDNLTYELWIDSITCNYQNSSDCIYSSNSSLLGDLKEVINNSGNNSRVYWNYSLGFEEETYGNYKNLTIVAYPSNSELENKELLNVTQNVKLDISHANHPINFSGSMGTQTTTYDNSLSYDLEDYFIDLDSLDSYYNETIVFNITRISGSTLIGYSLSDWNLIFSSTGVAEANWSIIASDNSTNVTSNNFSVNFITPGTTPGDPSGGTTGSTGGGTTTQTLSLKILVPETIKINKTGLISVPITLYNDGDKRLSKIKLSSIVKRDNQDINGFANFSQSEFDSIGIGDKENLSVSFFIENYSRNLYEIKINAISGSPEYSNTNSIFLDFIGNEATDVFETIVFTEGMINENPKCFELMDMVQDARKELDNGNTDLAMEKAEQALETCKNAINKGQLGNFKITSQEKVLIYVIIAFLISIVSGGLFNLYRWFKFKKLKKY